MTQATQPRPRPLPRDEKCVSLTRAAVPCRGCGRSVDGCCHVSFEPGTKGIYCAACCPRCNHRRSELLGDNRKERLKEPLRREQVDREAKRIYFPKTKNGEARLVPFIGDMETWIEAA